jgi:hypothetical protein
MRREERRRETVRKGGELERLRHKIRIEYQGDTYRGSRNTRWAFGTKETSRSLHSRLGEETA